MCLIVHGMKYCTVFPSKIVAYILIYHKAFPSKKHSRPYLFLRYIYLEHAFLVAVVLVPYHISCWRGSKKAKHASSPLSVGDMDSIRGSLLHSTLDILFLSNHNIHISSYGLYFLASDPLIDRL